MELDRNGLEVLRRSECLALLASVSLGRVGITIGALPVILPVHFRLVGEEILFRTGRGTKLDAATDGSVIAFEVDQVDPTYHQGWSVIVTGVASEASVSGTFDDEARSVPHWIQGAGEDRLVVVSTDFVSGRRIVPAEVARRRSALR